MGCGFSNGIPQTDQPHIVKLKTNKSVRYLTSKAILHGQAAQSERNMCCFPENVTQIKGKFNGEELMLVQKAISNHFLFFSLSENETLDLTKQMGRYSAEEATYIFKKGDQGQLFFILVNGRVWVQGDQKTKKILEKGSSFGQLALIYCAPRSNSVYAESDCLLWGLSSTIFRQFLSQITKKQFKFMKGCLQNIPLLRFLSEKQKDRVIFHSHRFKFQKGAIIFRRNDLSNAIFVVIQGRVEMKIPTKPKLYFERKDVFGEGCLTGDQFRSGTARCLEDTQCLAINKEALLKQLGLQSENILFYCICKWALKRSFVFSFLKKSTVDKIIVAGQTKRCEDGELIWKSGQSIESVLICLEGEINEQGVGAVFHDYPLDVGYEDLKKKGRGFIFKCSYDKISNILNQPFQKWVESRERIMKTVKKPSKTFLHQYQYLEKHQESDLGEILIVRDTRKRSKKICQSYKRDLLAKHRQQAQIKDYLDNLKNLKPCTLIASVENIIQDHQDYLFAIRQPVTNITLLDVLQERNLDETSCKFYIACIIEIIEHLHHANILHRNIKPENFCFLENGYLGSYDLSMMRKLNLSTIGCRTFTITGTPHYMAPQIMEAKGYSFPADVWSLGVTMYEMSFGLLPFGAQLQDPIQIYQQVIKKPIVFPHHYKDMTGMSLMTSMLCKNQFERQNLQNLKEMQYFSSFNFSNLLEGKTKPPEQKLLTEESGIFSAIFQTPGQPLPEYLNNKKNRPTTRTKRAKDQKN